MLINIYNPRRPSKELLICNTTRHCRGIYTFFHCINCFYVIPTPILMPPHTQLSRCCTCCNRRNKHVSITTWNPRWPPIWSSLLRWFVKLNNFPNIQHICWFWCLLLHFGCISNHTEYTIFSRSWQKAKLRHGHQNKFHGLHEYVYFLEFFLNLNFQDFKERRCTRRELI